MNQIPPFDPNNDRLARDIRNALSRALMAGLDRLDPGPAAGLAEQYLARPLAPVYQDYVRQRLDRYRLALSRIVEDRVADPVGQAVVLWNLGLFFEVHERLEGVWMPATGRRRLALQALIRAAGAYVHLENGRRAAAAGMAAKAVVGLREFAGALPELTAVEDLIDRLQNLDQPPPELFSIRP